MFWYTQCPVCRQGRLYLWKNVTADRLYLHCGECERGFAHPDRLSVAHSLLTLSREFEDAAPTWEDICTAGWQAYPLQADCSWPGAGNWGSDASSFEAVALAPSTRFTFPILWLKSLWKQECS
jgi:hypothetical protein